MSIIKEQIGIAGIDLRLSSCHISFSSLVCPCILLYKFPETPVPTIMPFTVSIIAIIVPPDIMNLNCHPLLILREYITEQHARISTNTSNHDY